MRRQLRGAPGRRSGLKRCPQAPRGLLARGGGRGGAAGASAMARSCRHERWCRQILQSEPARRRPAVEYQRTHDGRRRRVPRGGGAVGPSFRPRHAHRPPRPCSTGRVLSKVRVGPFHALGARPPPSFTPVPAHARTHRPPGVLPSRPNRARGATVRRGWTCTSRASSARTPPRPAMR